MRLRFGCAVLVATLFWHGSYIRALDAAVYNFVNIADTFTVAPSGNFTDLEAPAISNGMLAFTGFYSGGRGVFSSSGESVITIAKSGDAAPTGTFSQGFGIYPAISGSTVAFEALYNGIEGILIGSGGPLTPIVQTGDSSPIGNLSNSVHAPSISGDTVGFIGANNQGDSGVFTRDGNGPIATIATFDFNAGLSAPSRTSTSGNRVAFLYDGKVLLGDGDMLSTIAQTGAPAPSGTFFFVEDPSVSGNTVAFLGNYDGRNAILTSTSGVFTKIVRRLDPAPSGTFFSFDSNVPPALNGNTVAFGANYSGGRGIFVGSGGPLTTVLTVGDEIFGSTLTDFRLGPFALDDAGRVAFRYTLADGRIGVAVATPIPEPAGSSLLGLAAVLFILTKWARLERAQVLHGCRQLVS